MTLEERVAKLEKQMKRLNGSLLQMQKNQTPQTETLDNTVSGLDAITPYTETKTAYIGDTEIVFTDVPDGNLSVYVKDVEGNYPNHTIERLLDKVTVRFDSLENLTEVTISVV